MNMNNTIKTKPCKICENIFEYKRSSALYCKECLKEKQRQYYTPVKKKIKQCNLCNETFETKRAKTLYCKECKENRKNEIRRIWYKNNPHYYKKKNGTSINKNITTLNLDKIKEHYSYIQGIKTRGGINEIDIYKIIDVYIHYFNVGYYKQGFSLNDCIDKFFDKFDKPHKHKVVIKDKKIVKMDKNDILT